MTIQHTNKKGRGKRHLLLRFPRHAADDLRRRYPEESNVQLTRDGVRQQSLAASRRAMQEDASGL